MKAQRNPRDPSDTFLSFYAPTAPTVERIMQRRLEGEEDEADDEVNSVFVFRLFFSSLPWVFITSIMFISLLKKQKKNKHTQR